MDQHITAAKSLDRLFSWVGIAWDDDAAVWRVEPIPIALHRMFCRKRCDGNVCVFIDLPRPDFVGVHFPAVRYSTLVSLWVCAGLDVDAIGLQNVLGHRVQSGRTIYFERRAPTRSPSGKDQIRITSRVVGMKVRHKGHLQIAGFQLRDAPVKNSGLVAAPNARSEIDKIHTITAHDGRLRTGTVTS